MTAIPPPLRAFSFLTALAISLATALPRAAWAAPLPAVCSDSCAPPRFPFQRDVSVHVPAGTLSNEVTFAVPRGKRLVLEMMTGNVRIHTAELLRVTVMTRASDQVVAHHMAPMPYKRELPPDINPDFIVAFTHPIKIYADPGSTVTVTAVRTENGEISDNLVTLSVSGYLVDCGREAGCPIR